MRWKKKKHWDIACVNGAKPRSGADSQMEQNFTDFTVTVFSTLWVRLPSKWMEVRLVFKGTNIYYFVQKRLHFLTWRRNDSLSYAQYIGRIKTVFLNAEKKWYELYMPLFSLPFFICFFIPMCVSLFIFHFCLSVSFYLSQRNNFVCIPCLFVKVARDFE